MKVRQRLKKILYLSLCFLLFTPSFWAHAISNDLIQVKITGVGSKLRQNIIAHLGQLPKSKSQRHAFIFNAKTNINDALESVGYYQSSLAVNLTRASHSAWVYEISIALNDPIIVKDVDIKVDGSLASEAAYAKWFSLIPIKIGDRLNHGRYETTKSQLIGLALENGFFNASYKQSQIQINRITKSASIVLHFKSGDRFKFGQVDFVGSDLDKTLLHELVPFEHESYYSTDKISEFSSILSQTGYFRSIKVLPKLNESENEVVPIKVETQNRAPHSIEVGLGADFGSSSERELEPRVRLTWHTPQINRHGHSQQTSFEWSRERPKLRTTYTIPLSHPINDQLKIQVGLIRDKYGVTQKFDTKDGDFRTSGKLESEQFLYGAARQQIFKNNWIMSYSIKSLKEVYTQEDMEYSPLYYLLGLSFSRTIRSDDSLDPKSGFRQDYHFEYADKYLGSAIRLAKLEASYKWIVTPIERHRFVSRLDLGVNIATSDQLALIPPSLRYFAGGDQSIRGYGFQELGPYRDYIIDGQKYRQVIGGRYLAVASVEYQYYLTPKWRIATFVDAGNAYDLSQFKPLVSTGLGIHWISPVGPIRLNLGVGVNNNNTAKTPWRIHLTMGSEL
ncbi:outer membrane protein assembly factor [Shewanella sp. 202IG2-18]|nr:outer membrane protein assembly factor [Parashewanella hymeniacidonis]